MFVSSENDTKKRFQKPNILRKKPNQRRVAGEFPKNKSEKQKVQLERSPELSVGNLEKLSAAETNNIIADHGDDQESCHIIDNYQYNITVEVQDATENNFVGSGNTQSPVETINVESFLNNSEVEQIVTQPDLVYEIEKKGQEWYLDCMNNSREIIIEDVDGSHLGSLRVANTPNLGDAVPLSAVIQDLSSETFNSTVPMKNLTLEYSPNITANFKCDSPNCSKWFRSQQTLDKHKATHKSKTNKPVVIACPVKKVYKDGKEEICPVNCLSKDDMVKHLNEDHSPEDAMYICAQCNRRFYWASALRAHSRIHLEPARAPLVCEWQGCGRAFRQPCRLKEHMRTHTGDKPYPCQYPGCSWSFRTASKLMRHARGHTGERRHACAVCARAFRRPEHLREHSATQRCARHQFTDTGCEKEITTEDGLSTRSQKVHKQVEEPTSSTPELLTLEFASDTEKQLEEDTASYLTPSTMAADLKSQGIYFVTASPESSEVCSLQTEHLVNESMEVVTSAEISDVHTLDQTASDILGAVQMEPITSKTALDNIACQTLVVDKIVSEHSGVDETVLQAGEFNGGTVVDSEVFVCKESATFYVGKAALESEECESSLGSEVRSPRAARTHCSWPFDRAQSPPDFQETDNAQYALEEDSQAALDGGCESNTYTIRSDLFLHGNILHNEDSEQIAGVESSSLLVVPHTADPDLGLLEHPNIDLMQEELMYTDPSEDESSFRVFLLSGEELT